ncbi:hypothetical protein H6G35_19625 [Aulosira sp. FACHB-113]|nr:hypothetical protein [Aulosira sp. FACHB-113]
MTNTQHQTPITNYQLPITNYPLPITQNCILANFYHFLICAKRTERILPILLLIS